MSVTAFREGHDAMSVEVQFVPSGSAGAEVTIGDPAGPLLRMHEVAAQAPTVGRSTPILDREGDWNYIVTAGELVRDTRPRSRSCPPACEYRGPRRGPGSWSVRPPRPGARMPRKVLTEATAAMRDAQRRPRSACTPLRPLRSRPRWLSSRFVSSAHVGPVAGARQAPWRRCTAPGTSSSHAPRGPPSTRQSEPSAPHQTTGCVGHDGFRRGVPADPPDRPHVPQGPKQHVDPPR